MLKASDYGLLSHGGPSALNIVGGTRLPDFDLMESWFKKEQVVYRILILKTLYREVLRRKRTMLAAGTSASASGSAQRLALPVNTHPPTRS